MIHNKKLAFVATGAALMLASAAAQAQTAAQQAAGPLRGLAGASFQSPVAFGASWGGVGIGVYGQTIDNASEDYDGSAGIAFGLGNADKYVGLETVVTTSSLTGASGDDFGEAGSVSLKLHTNLPGHASFAVGVNGTGRWGNASNPTNSSSVYAVGSKFFTLGNTVGLVANLGMGDGVYQEIGEDGAAVFGSLALYITPRFSIIGEYTGRFANAAVSAAPFRSLPLTITLGAVNLGERYNDDVQFAGSVGLGFSF